MTRQKFPLTFEPDSNHQWGAGAGQFSMLGS